MTGLVLVWRDRYMNQAEGSQVGRPRIVGMDPDAWQDVFLTYSYNVFEEPAEAAQIRRDSLLAQLFDAHERLDERKSRIRTLLKEKRRIEEEHAEYERMVRLVGRQTISEVEKRVCQLRETYTKLKATPWMNPSKPDQVLVEIERLAKRFELVVERQP